MVGIQWSRRGYTPERFREVWLSASSVRQVALALGCNYTGGGYASLKAAAADLGLDQSHMTGKVWNQGDRYRDVNPARPLEEWLVDGSSIASFHLKRKLFAAGLKQMKCEGCGLTEWCGRPAPLALDHINGRSNDNRLENLRILCYNCHGLTETFAGRNIGRSA